MSIPANKWVQIGGDVSYEQYGLIIAYYHSGTKAITVVQIDPIPDSTKFSGEEETYDLSDLKEHTFEEFGLPAKDKYGLEMIALELLTTNGGSPMDCGAGGFMQDLRDTFPNFDTALQCAIRNESFTDFKGNEVKVEKQNVKKPLPYKGHC